VAKKKTFTCKSLALKLCCVLSCFFLLLAAFLSQAWIKARIYSMLKKQTK
jgi:hypothetical protein